MKQASVLEFILQRKKQSIVVVFFGLLAQLLTLMLPISVGKYYQLVYDAGANRARLLDFIPVNWWDTVPKFMLVFCLLLCLRYVFYFLYQFVLRKEAELFILSIKNALFNRQLSVNYAVYQAQGVSKYLLRYSGDLNSLKNLYLKGGLSVIADIFIIVVALVWLFVLSPLGAWVVVMGSILAQAVIYYFNQKIEQFSMQKRDRSAGQLSLVSRTLQAILSVVLMNKQEIEYKKYYKRSLAIKESAVAYHRWFVVNNGFIAFLQYGLLALILWLFYRNESTQIGGANLMSFILLYLTVLPVIRHIFRLPTIYHLGNISKRKLQKVYDLPIESIDEGEQLVAVGVGLCFEEVCFDGNYLNFYAQPGVVNELVLPATLTTQAVFYALMRLQEDYQGTIYLGDRAIECYAPKTLRDNIAIVSTKMPMLGRNVYEAITTSRSKRVKESTQLLLEHVQMAFGVPEEHFLRLEDKIGENGSALTLGQYELLCLLRGINHNKPIILVEAASLLSKQVMRVILSQQKKTVVWLSH